MVPMLRNVLTFLKFSAIPVSEFETKMELPQGSMEKFLDEKKELPPEIMDKLALHYRDEIQEQGYYMMDLTAFKQRGLGMIYGLKDEDNPFEEGTDDYTNWLIDHRHKEGAVAREGWLKIEVLGVRLPDAVLKCDYQAILDLLTEEEYVQDKTSSTDVLIFRIRDNFREHLKTTIYVDPKDGHNEHVFWTLG